jgi:anti-sigma B factor antagonist
MNVDFRKLGDVLVANVLDERLDAHSAGGLKKQVGEQVDRGERRIVLDLSRVRFVDSTGLGAMLSLLKRVSPAGNVVLLGGQPPLIELLRLTRLDRVFRVFASEAEASASFAE